LLLIIEIQHKAFINNPLPTITKPQHFKDSCFCYETVSSIGLGLSMRLVDNKV